jgi:hypothetical protein
MAAGWGLGVGPLFALGPLDAVEGVVHAGDEEPPVSQDGSRMRSSGLGSSVMADIPAGVPPQFGVRADDHLRLEVDDRVPAVADGGVLDDPAGQEVLGQRFLSVAVLL